MTKIQYTKLCDSLDKAKAALEAITPAYLAGISDEEFLDVVTTTSDYFAALRLVLLRWRQNA